MEQETKRKQKDTNAIMREGHPLVFRDAHIRDLRLRGIDLLHGRFLLISKHEGVGRQVHFRQGCQWDQWNDPLVEVRITTQDSHALPWDHHLRLGREHQVIVSLACKAKNPKQAIYFKIICLKNGLQS